MATLVLTTVGTLVGGPVGGAIGALIGQQADRALLAPKGRQGARLGDLTVQASRYGAPIPKLFGTLRIAGTVIWATDLIESQQSGGGGKAGPRTTSYSYSASFAVALSARPIRGVGRIWADGKLLRGAAGDWKAETAFRLYTGGEDQPVDPLIASAEGIGTTPAHRGIAYAVFEGLQLADFGNRIPSLSFEVVADGASVSLAAIAEELSRGAIAGETEAALGGYAALGDSVRGALQALAEAMPFTLKERQGGLTIGDPPDEPIALPVPAQGVRIDRRAAGTLPDEISIAYYEPARDFQAGLQRARRGGPARRAEAIELAAALSAPQAKALAEQRLRRDWSARITASLSLPWRHLTLKPGDMVTLPGRGERWQIVETSFERGGVRLDLKALALAAGLLPAASPGRAAGAEDRAHGPTRLCILDLPQLGETLRDGPRLWIVAAGALPGWRRAELSATIDGGASWTGIGATAAPATMGVVTNVLEPRPGTLRDDRSSLEVMLLHDEMALGSVARPELSLMANLALAGDELLQFAHAERIGPAAWRLTGLLRGRCGTEWATGGHSAGERFVLIEPAALAGWDLPGGAIGARVRVAARGVGDAEPVEDVAAMRCAALAPPAPVHLRAARHADRTVETRWVRRSRLGFAWLDGADVPVGQSEERYRIRLSTAGGGAGVFETAAPFHILDAAAQAAGGIDPGDPLQIAVAQIGEMGVWSRETHYILH